MPDQIIDPTQLMPRIWVGDGETGDNVAIWLLIQYPEKDRAWSRAACVCFGDIFVPGDEPMPTVNPADMEVLITCGSVDW